MDCIACRVVQTPILGPQSPPEWPAMRWERPQYMTSEASAGDADANVAQSTLHHSAYAQSAIRFPVAVAGVTAGDFCSEIYKWVLSLIVQGRRTATWSQGHL